MGVSWWISHDILKAIFATIFTLTDCGTNIWCNCCSLITSHQCWLCWVCLCPIIRTYFQYRTIIRKFIHCFSGVYFPMTWGISKHPKIDYHPLYKEYRPTNFHIRYKFYIKHTDIFTYFSKLVSIWISDLSWMSMTMVVFLLSLPRHGLNWLVSSIQWTWFWISANKPE